jgi:hypothetical protein
MILVNCSNWGIMCVYIYRYIQHVTNKITQNLGPFFRRRMVFRVFSQFGFASLQFWVCEYFKHQLFGVLRK